MTKPEGLFFEMDCPQTPTPDQGWGCRTTCRGFFSPSPPPDEQITTSITTGGDAFSPHSRVSSDQKIKNACTDVEIHPHEENAGGAE
jgi:hypothetical protein